MHKTGVGGKPQSMRAPITVKPTEQRRQARKDSAKDPAAATIHCFHCSRLQVFRARIGPTSHLCTHRPGQPHPPLSCDSSHRRHRRTNNNITHFITLYINNVFTCKRHGFFLYFWTRMCDLLNKINIDENNYTNIYTLSVSRNSTV